MGSISGFSHCCDKILTKALLRGGLRAYPGREGMEAGAGDGWDWSFLCSLSGSKWWVGNGIGLSNKCQTPTLNALSFPLSRIHILMVPQHFKTALHSWAASAQRQDSMGNISCSTRWRKENQQFARSHTRLTGVRVEEPPFAWLGSWLDLTSQTD